MVNRRDLVAGAASVAVAAFVPLQAFAANDIIQLGHVTAQNGAASVSINAAHQSTPTDRVWVQQVAGDGKITKVVIVFASGKSGIARLDKAGYWRLNSHAIVAKAVVSLSWPKGGSAEINFAGVYLG